MKRHLVLLLCLSGLLAPLGNGWAQSRWRDLPPEERQQMRQQMRDHWQQEQAARNDDMAQHARWRDLPPEDRRRMREEMREQGSWHDQRGNLGPGPGGPGGPGRGWR